MEIRYYGDKLSARIAKTPEGFLICQDVPISRTGYQEYLAKEIMDNPVNENKVIHVYRPAKEVFDIRSLASFEGKPVTNEHPDEDVTPENYTKYSCGHVQNVHVGEGEDSNKVLADLYITDPVLIKLIEDGKREVSCGYYAEEKKDPEGKLYQTKIRGNHVAVVRSGRAGNKVCIRDHNPFQDNHVETLSDYIDGIRYIKDEGKKGMKKGQHVMAKDPEYLAALKGAGAGTGFGVGTAGALTAADIAHNRNIRKLRGGDTSIRGIARDIFRTPGVKKNALKIIGAGAAGGALGGLLGNRFKNKKRSAFDSMDNFYGDESMNYYDDDEVMLDDDEILEDDEEVLMDDDEILEDDDDIMYDDDEELLDDDEELMDDDEVFEDDDELITDAGVKGMKKGQHVKARDPEYLAALKGGAAGAGGFAAGVGIGKAGRAIANRIKSQKISKAPVSASISRKALPSSVKSVPTSSATEIALSPNEFKTKGQSTALAKSKYNKKLGIGGRIKNFIGRHPTAFKRGALGAGFAAAGALGNVIRNRRNHDSLYYDDDEILMDDDFMYDDDEVMLDDDEILEDACRYEDENDIMYDDDEILEDDDDILEDDDEVFEDDDEEVLTSDADEVIANAKEAIADARYAINKINRRLNRVNDSEVVNDIEDDDEVLEDDDEELLDDDELLEDDEDIMYDDDEVFEDDDEELLDDDEELLDDDELLEDDEDEILDDDEVLEDDDEELLDDDEVLEDDDEELLDDDELLEDDDVDVTETEEIKDDNPEADAIDLDKSKALREITEASRGITDPNERKQLQDAVYSALCKKSQMSDIMRVTKKNKAARMDSAYGSQKKVSVADQQAIYDSFNPHKKTSF